MRQETRILEPEEIETLLGQINTRTPSGARNYALLQLMAQTGIRPGEALQVRAADIRRETWPTNGGQVKVWVLRMPSEITKGNQARQGLPLSVVTRQALNHWREKRKVLGIRGGPLFCTISKGQASGHFAREGQRLEAGKPLSSRYLRNLVARLAKKAGIEQRVHPHVLRHTALTNLYDRTQDLRLVQGVAGHAQSRTTERYTHVHPLKVARAMGAIEEAESGQDSL